MRFIWTISAHDDPIDGSSLVVELERGCNFQIAHRSQFAGILTRA